MKLQLTFKPTLVALFVAASCSTVNSEQINTKQAISKADLERITVTANRKQNFDTDLAMSVQSINKDALSLDNGQHVAESLNSISGVLIDQLSGGQGHKTSIRMPINTSGYYLYLQDNIPLQSPAFFNHNALWWSSFNTNVERVEVLKGAGTALYGSGAVAATINILSENIAEQPSTSLGITLGEYDYAKVQISHSEKTSEKHGYRISSSYLSNNGWRDHTGSDRFEVNFRHEYELSANERLVTLFVASDLEQEMAGRLTEDLYENDITNSGLSAEVLASDPLRKSKYARLSTQWDKFSGDNYYSLIPYVRYRSNDYTATWNPNMPKVESQVKTIGLLGLVNFEHAIETETTLGVDIELSEGDQLSYQPLDYTTTGWHADTYVKGEKFYDDTVKYTGIAPYFQHKRPLADNLILTIGARYDYANYDFNNHLGVYGDIGHGKLSLHDRSDNFNHFSPKASLNYHLNDHSSTYLRYANSFRIPTAGSLYHLSTKYSADLKSLNPEVSDTYELGYKANFDTLTLDAAIYYMDVSDGIVTKYDDNDQRYLTNASRVIHKGFEVATHWQISNEFNLSVAYSKSKHEFDQDEKYSGNEMKMAPDYIANVRFRYKPSALTGFSSLLEMQSIGEYWMDDANSQDADGNDRIYGGYTIFNIKARYKVNEQLSFNARILNVTDKKYAQEAEYRYRKVSLSPGAPRTLYVGLNYQW